MTNQCLTRLPGLREIAEYRSMTVLTVRREICRCHLLSQTQLRTRVLSLRMPPPPAPVLPITYNTTHKSRCSCNKRQDLAQQYALSMSSPTATSNTICGWFNVGFHLCITGTSKKGNKTSWTCFQRNFTNAPVTSVILVFLWNKQTFHLLSDYIGYSNKWS